MRDTAPWQRVLVWFKGSKEVYATHNFPTAHLTRCVQDTRSLAADVAGDLYIEKNERDPLMEVTTTEKPVSGRSGNTSFESYVTGTSTRPSSKATSRGWSSDAGSDHHATVSKSRTRTSRISLFSSHNPDEESKSVSPTISPTTTRPPVYVPRNAASGHLRTTNPSRLDAKYIH
ncbi:unnamed protein product [Aureobasidium mustum]|uniref:Uncharacterized protein n=1 Tax=Aureobasidium mustum TaxID=2773714 RepID=A0A9N8K738_9PEZI|nr:unnamed protein product [Aureobasidium mustum]